MIVCFVSNLGKRHRVKNANSMTHKDQQPSCIQTIEDRNESFSVRILNKFKLTHTEIVNLLNYLSGKSSTGEHKKNNDKKKRSRIHAIDNYFSCVLQIINIDAQDRSIYTFHAKEKSNQSLGTSWNVWRKVDLKSRTLNQMTSTNKDMIVSNINLRQTILLLYCI